MEGYAAGFCCKLFFNLNSRVLSDWFRFRVEGKVRLERRLKREDVKANCLITIQKPQIHFFSSRFYCPTRVLGSWSYCWRFVLVIPHGNNSFSHRLFFLRLNNIPKTLKQRKVVDEHKSKAKRNKISCSRCKAGFFCFHIKQN